MGKHISMSSIRRLTRQTKVVDALLKTKEEIDDNLTETCNKIIATYIYLQKN